MSILEDVAGGNSKEIISTSNQQNSMDVMSPYYIHASDSPGQVYVSELLHDGNYGEWVNDMSNALFAKNKIGFVDGTIPMPRQDSPNLTYWMRCNAMVIGWLKSAMDKEVKGSVRYAKTAREIWVDLEERFGKGSAPRAYEIRREITLLRQEKMTVSAYYTKLKSSWDELQSISPLPKCICNGCSCDVSKQLMAMREKEQLYDFLMGLDDIFGTVKTQILSTQPTPNLGSAYHLVAEDEQQKHISTTRKPAVEAAAFQTQGGHNDKDRANQRSDRKDKPRCEHCQKIGHTEDQCYEIIGYPPDWRKGARDKNKRDKGGQPNKQKSTPKAAQVGFEAVQVPGLTQSQLAKLIQFLNGEGAGSKSANQASVANMAGKARLKKPWVIDSGATDHITSDTELLVETEKAIWELPVTIPNGGKIPVKSVGKVYLPNGMKIDHVLNIPNFKCNLISVSRLTRNYNCALIFIADFCVIQDLPSRKLIGVGRLRDGLYYLEPVRVEGVAMSVKRGNNSQIWHRRLGHASNDKIRQIQLSSNSMDYENVQHCDSCLRAKQTRLPFPTSSIKTVSCFDLIHCDIWGGYKTPSSSGAHYFLSIVDDFSRGVWVYLMKQKSEVSYYLTMFCNMVRTQFGKKVKQIRADNGT